MNDDPVLIANPAAGGGRLRRARRDIEPQLRARWPHLQWRWTEGPGDAARIARESAGAGLVLSLGGDGTHSEVTSGLMALPGDERPPLAVLPAGTGGDFARLLYGRPTLDAALRTLERARPRPTDVGAATWTAADGTRREGWFLNIASVGLGGLVDRTVERAPKQLGGRPVFLGAVIWATLRYRAPRCRVVVDGVEAGTWDVANVFACNGRSGGAGMQWAPEASLDDGLLDILVLEQAPLLRSTALLPAIYRGTLREQRGVHRWRAREVEVTPVEGVAWLDLDGEAPGRAPLRASVVPGALTVLRP